MEAGVNPVPMIAMVCPATAMAGIRVTLPGGGATMDSAKLALRTPPPPDYVTTTVTLPGAVPMGTTIW